MGRTDNGKTPDTEDCSSSCSKRIKLSSFPEFELTEGLEAVVSQNEGMGKAWRESSVFTDVNLSTSIHADPFLHGEIHGFIKNEKVLDQFVEKAFSDEVVFQEKASDLFQFRQSLDLMSDSVMIDGLPELRKFFETSVLDFLTKLTGLPFTGKVDMFFSDYRQTDHLLCHDDELESRRIAFILYLSKDWKAEFGGLLDLYYSNKDIQPTSVAKSIVPEYNKFVFFDVSCKSFHQVSEVTHPDVKRLALSGWFLGDPLPRPKRSYSVAAPSFMLTDSICKAEHCEISNYVGSTYADPSSYPAINSQLEKDSEVMLVNFLKEGLLEEVSQELSSLTWKSTGPANLLSYFTPSQTFWPESKTNSLTSLGKMVEFFHSLDFLKFLEELTEFPFTDSHQETMIASQLCKYEQKCYKLLKSNVASEEESLHNESESDEEDEEAAQFVDVLYFAGTFNWKETFGGEIMYNDDEGEQLITISPISNSLAIIVRTKSVNSYVNYINSLAKDAHFFLYSMTFNFGQLN